ncbi:MAG: hypothetical protein Q4A89_10295 [Tannerella sp.]|nr:hypothetical protein [Tannerella sp.]
MLFVTATLQAQKVNWTSGYPKLDEVPFVMLEDERTLLIRFTPLTADINNAIIEVVLPPQVDFGVISAKTVLNSATLNISNTSSGSLTTGKTLAIAVHSNGNKLIRNTEVEIHIKVKAVACGTPGASDFNIQVKSGATNVTDGQKTVTVNIVKPSVALVSTDGTINFPTQTSVNTITYYLKTNTANQASSAKVTFMTDLVTTLSEFKIKGVPFTPTEATVGGKKTYTFAFTPALLGSKIDNTNDKVITFKGASTGCGSHLVEANVQYPHDTDCETSMGSSVTLAFPSPPLPNMVHVSTHYVDHADAPITTIQVNMDGTTPTVVKTIFRNTGGAAQNIQLHLRNYGSYNYLDISDIYMQVEGGLKRKITAGEITVVTTTRNTSIYGYLKPSALGKPSGIHILIPEEVPAGKTITFWAPTINGEIYDNTTRDVYHNYGTNTINGITSNITQVKSPCGDDGIALSQPHRIAYLNAPHYRELPPSLSIKGGQTKKQTVFIALGSTNETVTEFHVKAPVWLTIQSMKITSNSDGTGTLYGQATVTPGATQAFVSVQNRANQGAAYLHVEYKAAPCGGSTNQTAQIHYWANQKWSTKTLEKISQVFQEAIHTCDVTGISLDEFYSRRTTKGLKDTNNDRVPDNGSVAPDDEIRHDLFVFEDEGYFYWKGTIQAPGGYKYIDMPVKSVGFRFDSHVVPDPQNATVMLNGSPAAGQVTFARPTGNTGYFRYHYPAGLTTNTVVEIKVPFKVKAGTNNPNSMDTELYVSATPVANPLNSMNDPARKGKEKASVPIGTYNLDRLNWWNKDTKEESFPDNNPKINLHMGYTDIFHSGRLPLPYFPKEVRFHEYLEKLEFKLPKGYRIVDDLTIQHYKGAGPVENKTLAPESSTDGHMIYDIKSLYDLNFDGSGTLQGGKWQLPDDFWRLTTLGKIKALPSAKRDASIMKRISTWKNPKTGKTYTDELDVTFKYTGPGNSLEVSVPEVPAYGQTVKNPALTITNQTNNPIQDMWFYFEGDISDVKLKDADAGTVYNGTGLGNRWVKVANVPGNASKTFEMSYMYNFNDCTGDKVRVYTGAGFNNSWAPNTNAPLDPDGDNFSALDSFVIKPSANATIAGSITAARDTFKHESVEPYTIKVNFTTATSTGALKNPEMKDFTVPAGQIYKAGSARLEYPVGTLTPVPAVMEAALVAAFGTGEDAVRTIASIKLADAKGGDIILPGNLDTEATDADRTASVVMEFNAKCNTDFTGIQYKGQIAGISPCGTVAAGSGIHIVSRKLYPNVTYNYLFEDIKIAPVSGTHAFNEIQIQDTLKLTVKKITGTVNNMVQTDHLMLQMPKELNVDGESIFYKGSGSMSGLDKPEQIIFKDSVDVKGVRYVKLPMPIDEYNAAANKGVGAEITCHIPVKYTPNGHTRKDNPVDSIIASVNIFAIFGNCPPIVVPVGTGKDSIGLFTAKEIPARLYVGELDTIEILSNGFRGSWYLEKNGGTLQHTGAKWPHAPTDSSKLGELMYYFTPIINGHNFGGRLPYPVKIWIHPWFIRNLDPMKYICEEQDTLFVKGGGMEIKYQWFHEGNVIAGATDTSLIVRRPGKYHVEITDTVPETVSSDTMEVYFREIPTFIKDLPSHARECDNWRYLLSVKTTGKFMQYQWYRNGLPIKGATKSSYYALAKDSSAFFRVSVKNPCGDSIVSNQCYLSFCDEKIHGINRLIELNVPLSIETDPRPGQLIFVESQQNFQFTVKAKNGYSLKYVTVTTDSPIWNEQGGIKRTMLSDSVMEVTILTVTQNLKITVSGVSPVGNQEIIRKASRVWAYEGRIYVETDRPATVYVFTTMGHLYRREKVQAGLTSFDAQPGVYFVKFDNGDSSKVWVE